ncbi:hypothetical protein FOPG_19508 [Fusarium oxysporum f. sp. conglutinans race 2 54008]|uniref:Zinc-ribbon domain-containing protein n=2 Tax=Fusarium oxysporum f. sp. conglutinans TaxID=100902 RepID=A0A8H6GVK2_FUSOX|nr:hypothetical protein FOPG_19508 [Fusarium oxysporum f. sp. conglutinans race 2 54008]KAF6525582.1 hypothetical protein HZS61_011377 [Fusarium oxysporum f. sp. conglutinans]KAG6996573.1 hypothetical protein FocnCong_v015226 [Fusarium oxysporum f. sp. conglutinans]KAI8411231.1 hypothetical protein FOFC_07825 [Fusarium oxysporum]
MFGRRRRPILGAAVVYGASRAAAKHEVRKQELMASERDREIEREVDLRRREEEEQELRTQRAVDEAMKKAALQEQAAQQSAAAMMPPQPRYDEAYPMVQAQTRDLGVFSPANDGNTIIQPAPAYQVGPQKGPVQGPVPGSRVHYCTQCGLSCQDTDRFCRQCGARQAAGEIVVG